jgi:hypothetical protein
LRACFRKDHPALTGALAALVWAAAASSEAQAPSPSPPPAVTPPPAAAEAPPLPGGQVSPEAQQAAAERTRAEATGTAAARTPSRWRLILGLRGLYEENPRFVAGAPETLYPGEGGSLSLSRFVTGRRSELILTGTSSATNYHDVGDADRFEYSGGLSIATRPSERTTFTTRHDYASAFARDASVLAANGLLVPNANTRTYAGEAALGTRLSRRGQFTLGGRFRDVRFESSDLADGWAAYGDAQLSWSIGTADNLSIAYEYQRMQFSATAEGDTHTASAGWEGRVGRRWRAGLRGGASFLPARGPLAAQTTPYGSADLTGTFRRGGVILRYGRTVSPAFGFARPRVADLGSGTVRRVLGRRTEVSATVGYGLSHDPFDDAFELRTTNASANLRWQIGQESSLGLLYSFADSRSDEAPAAGALRVRAHRVALTLAFGKTW